MDQETAQILFREGATMVCIDVPEGTEFGFDYSSWTAGPLFKGVKMIPPGIHFVYYRYILESYNTRSFIRYIDTYLNRDFEKI